MKFIPVSSSIGRTGRNPLTRFPDNLKSIATRCSQGKWDLNSIIKDMKLILKKKQNTETGQIGQTGLTYLDSGGYQMIKNDISPNRFREWIDTYHTVLDYRSEDIDKIFSLDVNGDITRERMIQLNTYSIQESQKLLKKNSGLKDKQIFVIQSRTPDLLSIWTELMQTNKIHESHDHYALGGLVGLRSKISHVVPMTIWLMDYLDDYGKKPKSLHYLGQSSLLVMILAGWFEKEYDIEITMDSSTIVRPQSPKVVLPVLVEGTLVETMEELRERKIVIDLPLSSFDIQEMISINLYSYQNLSNELPHDIMKWSKKDFEDYHPVFKQGRISSRLEDHFRYIRDRLDID